MSILFLLSKYLCALKPKYLPRWENLLVGGKTRVTPIGLKTKLRDSRTRARAVLDFTSGWLLCYLQIYL